MVSLTPKRSALILIGGYGTCLRPLTLTIPKPFVPFANKPILCNMIEILYKAGVSRIVLATSSRDSVIETVRKYIDCPNLEILFSYEDQPLGTAGPLKQARHLLTFPCYILNSDIICNFPLLEMMDFHLLSKKSATILATTVKDPSKYGVIITRPGSCVIEEFVEKPGEYVGNRINAGVYVIDESVVDFVCDGECSIEKDVFPVMAMQRLLGVFDLAGYWMDIGVPRDYLEGVRLYLRHGLRGVESLGEKNDSVFFRQEHKFGSFASLKKGNEPRKEFSINSNVKEGIDFYSMGNKNISISVNNSLIDNTAEIGVGCVIGPNVVIGGNVKIGNYVRLRDTTVFANTVIRDGCCISSCIIGWDNMIGNWVRMDNCSVLGSRVIVEDCVALSACVVLPFKRIMSSSDSILM